MKGSQSQVVLLWVSLLSSCAPRWEHTVGKKHAAGKTLGYSFVVSGLFFTPGTSVGNSSEPFDRIYFPVAPESKEV